MSTETDKLMTQEQQEAVQESPPSCTAKQDFLNKMDAIIRTVKVARNSVANNTTSAGIILERMEEVRMHLDHADRRLETYAIVRSDDWTNKFFAMANRYPAVRESE